VIVPEAFVAMTVVEDWIVEDVCEEVVKADDVELSELDEGVVTLTNVDDDEELFELDGILTDELEVEAGFDVGERTIELDVGDGVTVTVTVSTVVIWICLFNSMLEAATTETKTAII
jgi:hypothetical protein